MTQVAPTYNPSIIRFLFVDPLLDFFPNQTPYSYAYNNPISYRDPSGLAPEGEKGNKNQIQGWFFVITNSFYEFLVEEGIICVAGEKIENGKDGKGKTESKNGTGSSGGSSSSGSGAGIGSVGMGAGVNVAPTVNGDVGTGITTSGGSLGGGGGIDVRKVYRDTQEARKTIIDNAKKDKTEWGFTILRNTNDERYVVWNMHGGEKGQWTPWISGYDREKYELIGFDHTHKETPLEPYDYNYIGMQGWLKNNINSINSDNQFLMFCTTLNNGITTYGLIYDAKAFGGWYENNYQAEYGIFNPWESGTDFSRAFKGAFENGNYNQSYQYMFEFFNKRSGIKYGKIP